MHNPETHAFVKAYQADIEDDNEEFAHLEQEDGSLTLLGGHGEDDQRDEEDEDEEPQEVVSAVELQEQLRRVARGEEVSLVFDTLNFDSHYP